MSSTVFASKRILYLGILLSIVFSVPFLGLGGGSGVSSTSKTVPFLAVTNSTQLWNFQTGSCTIPVTVGSAIGSCSSTYTSPFPSNKVPLVLGSISDPSLGTNLVGVTPTQFLSVVTPQTWVNFPLTETELFGNTQNRFIENPLKYYQVSLGVDCIAGSSGPNPQLALEWSNDSITWAATGANVTVSNSNCPGTLKSSPIFVHEGIFTTINPYLRIVGLGGAGLGDSISVTEIYAEWTQNFVINWASTFSATATTAVCQMTFNVIITHTEASGTCNWQAGFPLPVGAWPLMGPNICEIFSAIRCVGTLVFWNDTSHRIGTSLTGFSKVKLTSNVNKIGTNGLIWIQYYNGATWVDLCGSGTQTPSNPTTSLGIQDGTKCSIDAPAITSDTLLRIVGKSPTNQTPSWTIIQAEFST